MSVTIRQTTQDDLQGIADLFLPRHRSVDQFHWILSDSDGHMRSLVAEADGEVVGHVAWIESQYAYRGETLKGIFTIEWLVKPAFTGQTALSLYSKAMKLGDFTFVIGGTDIVAEIYPHLKFHVPHTVSRFLKVIRPLPYFQHLDNPPWKRLAKTAHYARGLLLNRESRYRRGEITLTPWDGAVRNAADPGIVMNSLPEERQNWLITVPDIAAHPFTIRENGEPIGSALCYIQNTNGVLTGRIAHVSWLGSDRRRWLGVLYRLEEFLTRHGCCIVTTMASHPMMVEALAAAGHQLHKKSPLWLRDRKRIFAEADWHLTYAEGDHAFRGMYPSDFVQPPEPVVPRSRTTPRRRRAIAENVMG